MWNKHGKCCSIRQLSCILIGCIFCGTVYIHVQTCTMLSFSCSRKYPYHPHGRFFGLNSLPLKNFNFISFILFISFIWHPYLLSIFNDSSIGWVWIIFLPTCFVWYSGHDDASYIVVSRKSKNCVNFTTTGLQITVCHQTLVNQNLLMSNKILTWLDIMSRQFLFIINHFMIRMNINLPRVNLTFLAMSDHNNLFCPTKMDLHNVCPFKRNYL